MEVNHDKLSSLATFGLMVVRSGSNTTAGPLFAECLQPYRATTQESSALPQCPVASGSSPATVQKPATVESADDGSAEDEIDESEEEQHDSDETAADAQTAAAAAPTASTPPGTAEIAVTEELGEALAAIPESGSAVAQPSPTAVIDSAGIAQDESVADPAAAGEDQLAMPSPDATESSPEGTKATADKSKRGKLRQPSPAAGSVEASGESESDKSSQPAATAPVPPAEQPEETTEADLPEISSLHRSPADDAAPSTAAKEPSVTAADNQPPPPEPSGPAASPAVDPPASAAQPDVNPAGGVAAAALKPPAAFLKSKSAHHDAARPAGEIDPARFLSRVVNAFESAHQRGSEVRLRLHPVELGALNIEIKIHDSILTASVQAETTEAKAAIVDNLPALRERLAEQGIRVDQFDVDLMDHSDGRQQSLEEQGRRQEDRQANAPRSANRRAAASESSAAPPARPRSGGQNGLNVVI